ncbi:MAG: hypothetical protein QMD77_00680 [Patescibacteria group bacterium]|nr:hypothetical protein [Patescibacteria group bacterium]
MLNRLRKHSVKIFVFTINILLAAIAVFIIRGKDQARLLEDSGERQSDVNISSFKENINLDPSDGNSEEAMPETQPDSTKQNPASSTIAPSDPIPSPSTMPVTPAPTVKQPASPDRKTKTS